MVVVVVVCVCVCVLILFHGCEESFHETQFGISAESYTNCVHNFLFLNKNFNNNTKLK